MACGCGSAAEWCSLLIQQRGVRGPSTAVSELRSRPTLPNPWPGACSDYLCHLKEVRREQYSEGRITSDVPAPLEIQAVRDLLRARGREMQAENLNAQVAAQVGTGLVRASCADRMMACLTPACCLHLQVDAALSAGQLRQSLQAAFQQKQWQWAYLLRMAMTFMPATLGRSDDLRKLPWSCLALRTQDNVGPVPSVAILFGSMHGEDCEAWAGGYSWCRQVCAFKLSDVVELCAAVCFHLYASSATRYRDHRICPQAALADLAVATFHRGIKLEDLAKFIVAAPSMHGEPAHEWGDSQRSPSAGF